jgi:enoyl-CoA hydratase/carnithine racemase
MPSHHHPRIHTEVEALGDSGHLARVTVDNQHRLNVLGTDQILELTAAIRTLEPDRQLRCVVLTGAGERAFIGGADIRDMVDLAPATAYQFISRLHLACAAIRRLPVPVIARIHGFCLGAGLEIAASCDLRVASDDATFGMPEVKVGIPSVIEAALLPRLVGPGRARRLVFTGESISAATAEHWGLVDWVVPGVELDDAVHDWVRAIGAAGARAIRLQKTLVRRWDTLGLDHAIQASMRSFASAYETDEPHRLMQGFLDRKSS